MKGGKGDAEPQRYDSLYAIIETVLGESAVQPRGFIHLFQPETSMVTLAIKRRGGSQRLMVRGQCLMDNSCKPPFDILAKGDQLVLRV